MRAKWLIGVAVSAWLLTGSVGALAPEQTASRALQSMVFSEICGPRAAQAQRAWLASLLAASEAYAQTLPDANAPPPLMEGLGTAHLDITTQNPTVQAYFDQGLRFLHNFNHAEAIRAFKEGQRLDPNCAMCFWGEAFALGPNINAPMNPDDNAAAYAAMRAAHDKAATASPVERALIDAMQSRYTQRAPRDRARFDNAFADAMIAAANAHPENDLVQVFSAEAAMDAQPWDYWEPGGRAPKGRIVDAIGRIETVLARSPDNAGANHLYIHLAEASTNPWRAERAAENLETAAPAAGHLVHMPAHIYYRVGRFRESIRANIAAAAADEAYMSRFQASPMYQYGYYPHNLHFVMTSAMMGGDGATALDYAERLDAAVPMQMAAQVVLAQPVKASPWFARAQFAPPETVIAAAAPPEGVSYVTGAWRFSRGVAFARLGQLQQARAEAAALDMLITGGDFSAMNAQNIPAQDILQVYRHVLLGRIAMMARDFPTAISELEDAADRQTRIPYTEPPYIFYPVRRTLGAAYLMNDQPALAEMQFLQTLLDSPNDAYAYWGLSEARRARGDRTGASGARQLFRSAYLGRNRQLNIFSL